MKAAALACGLAAAACASPTRPRVERVIPRLFGETLRLRRPPGPGALPAATPGGTDFAARPPPDERFDCRLPAELFSTLDLPAVRACLDSLKEGVEVAYDLKRVDVPYLQLAEAETNPPCLIQVLPRIPVPREIFFQAPEPERDNAPQCYSARLDIDADKVLGTPFPKAGRQLTVTLPFDESLRPKDDPAAVRLLTSWALTPFFDPSAGGIPGAIVVADRHCRRCLGAKGMLDPARPPPPLWP